MQSDGRLEGQTVRWAWSVGALMKDQYTLRRLPRLLLPEIYLTKAIYLILQVSMDLGYNYGTAFG